jgi:2'-5' RNA ligase
MDAIYKACGAVAAPPFPVVHDRLTSFQPSGAGVLLCTAGTATAIQGLRVALIAALKSAGVRCKPSSTPHLTIFYEGQQAIAESMLDAPLTWHAVDFCLLVSHQGLGHHEVVRSSELQT